ncbi:MAG TPA: thiolase domain-containing protein [Polyangiaceae bacterium]|nr:thiolase domain-containing protein [Polyangiaceae bacterium]
MRDVYVIGLGLTRFGELWDESLRDLFVDAAKQAITDARIDRLDGMYVGCMSGGLFVEQEHLSSLLADYLGALPIPSVRVESACASGGMALRSAFFEVASGASEVVLAGGVEKMTDGADVTRALATASDQEYEAYQGVTFPGLYGMMAREHMRRYGTTREQIAAVAVKNHGNAVLNPNAQLRAKITVADVLASTMVADPLRLLDCSPVSDGAAAVLVASAEYARKSQRPLVKVTGVGAATDTIALHAREDLAALDAVARAAAKAYAQAGRGPRDVHVAEVHDCFTIAEIMATEALGFFELGRGGLGAGAGETARGGRIPVNTSGGLKAKGHPVGATGIAQVAEIMAQLRGEAGARQIKGARVGLAQNMGGSGGSATVHILEVA